MRFILLWALLAVLALPAAAQEVGRAADTREASTVPTYFLFTQRGVATVRVQVIGSVRQPGLYEVMEGTDLGEVLALAGGPLLEARQRTSRRTVTLRLFRPTAAQNGPLYEATLEAAVTSPLSYPALRDDDVLYVEVVERQRFGWRDTFTILGGLSALAFAIQSIVSISGE